MTTAQIEPTAALAELREAKPDRVTIVLLSGDLDKAMAAFIIATGAAAMGMQVTVFFTFWGLNTIRKKGVQRLTCCVGCSGSSTRVEPIRCPSRVFISWGWVRR